MSSAIENERNNQRCKLDDAGKQVVSLEDEVVKHRIEIEQATNEKMAMEAELKASKKENEKLHYKLTCLENKRWSSLVPSKRNQCKEVKVSGTMPTRRQSEFTTRPNEEKKHGSAQKVETVTKTKIHRRVFPSKPDAVINKRKSSNMKLSVADQNLQRRGVKKTLEVHKATDISAY